MLKCSAICIFPSHPGLMNHNQPVFCWILSFAMQSQDVRFWWPASLTTWTSLSLSVIWLKFRYVSVICHVHLVLGLPVALLPLALYSNVCLVTACLQSRLKPVLPMWTRTSKLVCVPSKAAKPKVKSFPKLKAVVRVLIRKLRKTDHLPSGPRRLKPWDSAQNSQSGSGPSPYLLTKILGVVTELCLCNTRFNFTVS
jgi:hypothetical protein